jgi:hypothetical protein
MADPVLYASFNDEDGDGVAAKGVEDRGQYSPVLSSD